MKKSAVIIAAAGSGKRMGGGIPKLYRQIEGLPVLVRTLRAFCSHPRIGQICIVTRPEDLEFCQKEIVEAYGIGKVKAIVSGGEERQDSIYSALSAIDSDTDYILVQDGARPFVTAEVIDRVLDELSRHVGVVPAVACKDTVKRRGKDGFAVETPDRSQLFSVQTPQGFHRDILLCAYRKAFSEEFYGTDDAVLVERIGEKVYLVKGDCYNIKITTPEDINMAEAILKEKKPDEEGEVSQNRQKTAPIWNQIRTGSGFDVHAFQAGRALILGGVEIPHEKGLLGHSDADVLTHAVMDAMLGACGLGDIGRHFPDHDPAYEGISSLVLLKQVRQLVFKQGYQLGNLDATLIAQRPKLSPYIDSMTCNLGQVLGLSKDELSRVNVKATTTEHLGFTGREEGIAAMATVLLYQLEASC